MENQLIKIDRSPDGVATITINRPKSLNSLTKAMITDLARAFKALDADESVRVIVICGAGRAFCSGVDLTAAEEVFKGDVKDVDTDPVFQMEHCRKPIIGAVGGFAVTAGFEIALACDVLIAGKNAKFIDTHARNERLSRLENGEPASHVYNFWSDCFHVPSTCNQSRNPLPENGAGFGIFPSWGLSQKLSRIIGPNRAREVSLTCMPITAEMAEKWGLVNHVVEGSEVLKKAHEVAEAMIRNNQDLVLRYKSVINDGFKLDLSHALALEKERGHAYYDGMTKDQFQKMQTFIASRSSKPSSKL
ncbi:hypothetical protein ACLOJK_017562 [Asimina triloba]